MNSPALLTNIRFSPVAKGVIDRLLSRYQEAADTVFMDGSTPWDVDEAMVEFGYAMGPYETEDLMGLDAPPANRHKKTKPLDSSRRYIPIANRMLDLGKLGKKTGAGWYRYPGGNGKVEDPIVADLALEEAHFAGRARTDYSADEIRSRLLLAMINEAADILDEGVVASTADIDHLSVLGCGFPSERGGLMCYANTLGTQSIVAQLSTWVKEDPVAWRVSAWLQQRMTQGLPISN